jgi:hypothetical protein
VLVVKGEKGAVDRGRDLIGQGNLGGVCGHRSEDPELVGDVVEMALPLATHLGRVLADQMEDGDAVVVGGGHGGHRVEGAGAVGGEGHPDPARSPGVAVGHEHR